MKNFKYNKYEICGECDHFIEENNREDVRKYNVAEYFHLDSGEKEHNHDATPSGMALTLNEWRLYRPDLFWMHEDGLIGPNSIHHKHTARP